MFSDSLNTSTFDPVQILEEMHESKLYGKMTDTILIPISTQGTKSFWVGTYLF